MNKYFIEYPKKKIYTCFDGRDGFINLKFKHKYKEFLFVGFVFKNDNLVDSIKRALKLKDRSNDLYLVLSMIIDQFNADPKKDKKGEFKYSILPEKDRHLKFEEEKYPSIHIFTDGQYYDHTYSEMMVYSRIRKKLPVIYFNF